jgi:integration host factor subunit beta
MNKQDLIVKFAEKEGLAYADSRFLVDMFFDKMEKSLVAGERVEIRGFGSFKVKEYAGYTGRNPRSGEKVKVKSKKLPFFKVGKELKERVDVQ